MKTPAVRADNSGSLKMGLCYIGQYIHFIKKIILPTMQKVWCSECTCWNRLAKDNCAVSLYLPWQPNWPATMESCHQDYQNSTYTLERREKLSENYPAIAHFSTTTWQKLLVCMIEAPSTTVLFSFLHKIVNLCWNEMWNKHSHSQVTSGKLESPIILTYTTANYFRQHVFQNKVVFKGLISDRSQALGKPFNLYICQTWHLNHCWVHETAAGISLYPTELPGRKRNGGPEWSGQ